MFWEETNVLMSVAGSALHNLLYLRRGSVVIILMQKGWGPWAWMYANQAKLLGMEVLVYFDDDDEDEQARSKGSGAHLVALE